MYTSMKALNIIFLSLVSFSSLLDTYFANRIPVNNELAKKPEGTLKTFKGGNGQIIDCVDIYMQPALNNPLLENHTLEHPPSSGSLGVSENNEALDAIFDISWRKNGGCPDGSVPIVRHIITDLHFTKKSVKFSDPASYNNGHQYAVVFIKPRGSVVTGARGTISIWDPHLARKGDFSLGQIWITAGPSNTIQTVEAGWQKYPLRTGYAGPVFFIYFTNYGYRPRHGCYDLVCKLFIQASKQYAPGMHLITSVYDGKQSELDIIIQRESTGSWWLYLGQTAIGYWPSRIFKGGPLYQAGDNLSWGGEIVDTSGNGGFHTLTQMGSGHFPSEGYEKASYIRNIVYNDTSGNTIVPTKSKFIGYQPASKCYKYDFQNVSSEPYMFFGGPGCK